MAEDIQQKIYECPNCGKQYLKAEQLNAHMRVHKSDNYVTRDELKEAIKAAISEALSPSTTSPPAATTPTPATPPPARIGQFIVKPKPTTGTEDIICPYCGTVELDRPMAVVEREKPVEREVEVIPRGYIAAPKGGDDWLRLLDLKHIDGKGVDECPDCAKTLLTWFNQHKSKLERASRGG